MTPRLTTSGAEPTARPITSPSGRPYDAVVIGGGFVGCMVALALRARGESVLLLEREPELLRRASYANQARVHNGHHYPRALLTALRSRVNFPRFVEQFGECVSRDVASYYAVARHFSKVTPAQFASFCRRIDAPAEPVPPSVRSLFDRHLIADVFLVQEHVFDAVKLRTRLCADLRDRGVDVLVNATARRVSPADGGAVRVAYDEGDGRDPRDVVGRQAYNCTYAAMNDLLVQSGLPPLALRHERAELALVQAPAPFEDAGVTVMCGPFFSLLPFPHRRLHSLSHVRYTPHAAWTDGPPPAAEHASNFSRMLRDAARYVPVLHDAAYVESLWETKTVLPEREADDGRPVLFQRDCGIPNLSCILGGKLDNVYDVLDELDAAWSGAAAC